MGTAQRTCQDTHPWINFQIDMRRADPFLWMALGEIQSKCEHVAGVPLRPDAAAELHELYLAKGIMATAAIEGNTLSEEEVERRIKGDLKLPPSKEYLGTEIDNILEACNLILQEVVRDGVTGVSAEDLCRYNGLVLKGLKVDEDVVPGEVRRHSAGVGRYRGAPAEDCEYLLERLCQWLSGSDFEAPKGFEIVYGVLKAIIAHIYIAWVHPFGDGNGRTARLVEVRLLLEAGAPSAAAHLLSNFYNQTRTEYYRQLDAASRSGGDILPFIKYAS
jgi:Fic family protein